jgi:acyl transferase domain-containing protein
VSAPEPIAIIGAACRFPGAHGLESFWRLLRDGVDAIRPITREGLEPSRFYDPRPQTPGRMATRWGGFLDDLELFDADFFGISPREAQKLDPAQRILLETAWEACEDAGIDTATLAGQPVGVFVGQWLSDFESRLFADLDDVDFHATTGSGRYATPGRLSYVLGLTGPSVSVDTACASSLVAVHLACQSLRTGETPLAFAAGVNVILQPHITVAYSQSGMMAPDGRCKFGDAEGDGYVRSEGVGVLLLKRLSQAIADADPIHAVIRGSAVNNDGRGSGHLATPSREGQAAMLEMAYTNAGVSPATVEYVEAHGTGTRVGDPVELGALGDVLALNRKAGSRCYVGSVKTNIGHTEGAAGMAGLIKSMLALEHEEIPASLHLRTPNPAIPWAELPFKIPKRPVAWPRAAHPRVAGVSAFGIAGTNAHVVLEEAPKSAVRESATRSGANERARAWPLVLSAASRPALRAMAAAYAERLGGADAPALRDVCATAAFHRTALAERAVFVAADRDALVTRLRAFATGDEQGADVVRRADHEARRRVAFVVPGQGGQWLGMARELLATEPRFAETIASIDAALPSGTKWSVRGQLLAGADQPGYRLNEIGVLQPVLVAIEIALAELWRSLGVEPDAIVGHSMGEVGAAYFAGAISLEDAMLVICERSRLLQRTSGSGAMALLELSANETSRRLSEYGGRLCIAVLNGPRSTVVAGDPQAVAALRDECEREGIFCRAVQVDVASHSPQMDPLVPELTTAVRRVAAHEAAIPLYSTVEGSRVDGRGHDADYWGRNLRWPVRFASAVEAILDDGIDTFIEVSPHPALLVSIAQIADERRAKDAPQPIALASLRRNEPEWASVLASLGALWAAGHPIDWTKVLSHDDYTRVTLPSYPWQRERHWPALAAVEPRRSGPTALPQALDDEHRDWLYVTRWVSAPVAASESGGHWLIVGDPASDLRALSDSLVKRGATTTIVSSVAEAAKKLREPHATDAVTRIVVVVGQNDPQPAWEAIEALRAFQNAHAGNRPPRIWWITRGTHRVGTEGLFARAAEQGALWGAARVLATEHPDWWGGLVDLEMETALPLQSDAVAAHLTAPDAEDQVAIRRGARFARRLSRAGDAFDPRPVFAWRADGAYLLTGGFGGVGQQIALEMIRQGARRLVLMVRSALPPRAQWPGIQGDNPAADRVAFVRALEHAGAAVHVLHADVGDPAQVEAALAAYHSEGWPSIVGAVHAAALIDNRLTNDMDAEAFARVLSPKLDGALTLDRLLPKLDLFVLFSSMSALWAPAGMSNYAAANAGLDALAVARRARGQHAVSIQWGPWEDLGLYRNAGVERSVSDLAREGLQPFSPRLGTRFLAPVIGAREPVVAVLSVDWTAFAAARRGRESSLFRDVLKTVESEGEAGDGLASRFSGAADATRHAMVETAVRTALAAVLRRPAGELDAARPFGNMGLDSLMALELRNRLESAIERSLPATIAWNYPTLTLLVAHLESLVAATADARPDAQPVRVSGPSKATATPAESSEAVDEKPRESGGFGMESLFGEVVQLSDEDAARALRRGA